MANRVCHQGCLSSKIEIRDCRNCQGLSKFLLGLYSPNHLEYENKRYTIEKPYKIATRNAKKIWNFPKFVRFLGHFLKKQCFWKMGVAGIKQLPCPSKIASFSGNLNGEALLKVSFKNVDWFQKYKALKWKIFHFPYEIVFF